MEIKVLTPVHPFSSNTYLISDGSEYAVVDPSVPFDLFDKAERIKYILLTHSHFDHILDIDSWCENTNASVVISKNEASFLSDPEKNCYMHFLGRNKGYYGPVNTVEDGDTLNLGSEKIKVIATPGHTRGSVCYLTSEGVFVGDTVFAGGGFGRCDLPSGDFSALLESISKISSLPDETVLYPGHGEDTTVLDFKKDFIL